MCMCVGSGSGGRGGGGVLEAGMQLHSGSIVSFSRKRSQLHSSRRTLPIVLAAQPLNFKVLFSKRRRPPPSLLFAPPLPPPCSPSVSFVFPTVHFVLLPVFSGKNTKKKKTLSELPENADANLWTKDKSDAFFKEEASGARAR